MSSIPNAKMKHAHVQHDASATSAPAPAPAAEPRPETLTDRARDLAEDAIEVVKDRPRTVAAIGAAVLAGAAALIGGPAIAKAVKGTPAKAAKKTPARRKN